MVGRSTPVAIGELVSLTGANVTCAYEHARYVDFRPKQPCTPQQARQPPLGQLDFSEAADFLFFKANAHFRFYIPTKSPPHPSLTEIWVKPKPTDDVSAVEAISLIRHMTSHGRE